MAAKKEVFYNMTLPLISVIMPAYNSEKYTTEAIESVIRQTYTNWELIVIDDGSSDGTVCCIEGQAAKDVRIRFYKNDKNIGVSETRNKAISLANGEWIAFLDSDDIWKPQKLEKQIKLSEMRCSEFVFTGVSFIDEAGQAFRWAMPVPTTVTYRKLLKQNVIACSSVMLKKELLLGRKMAGDAIHEDFALWLEILKNNTVAHGIDEPLIAYRVYGTSKSGNKIKSSKMTYKTYLNTGLGHIQALYYMFFYMINGLLKYSRLYRNGY